jgi:ABC-type Fe3+-citrate transport system substrate-binding protein
VSYLHGGEGVIIIIIVVVVVGVVVVMIIIIIILIIIIIMIVVMMIVVISIISTSLSSSPSHHHHHHHQHQHQHHLHRHHPHLVVLLEAGLARLQLLPGLGQPGRAQVLPPAHLKRWKKGTSVGMRQSVSMTVTVSQHLSSFLEDRASVRTDGLVFHTKRVLRSTHQ